MEFEFWEVAVPGVAMSLAESRLHGVDSIGCHANSRTENSMVVTNLLTYWGERKINREGSGAVILEPECYIYI